MASIETRRRGVGVVWRVHYRLPNGTQRNKTFANRLDAERFVADFEASLRGSQRQDSDVHLVTVGEWAEVWLAGQGHLKPSTLERYAGVLRAHVVPTWGGVRLDRVSHTDVQIWVASLSRSLSPLTVHKIHRVLSLLLEFAVRDGRLGRNVARHIKLPRPVRREHRILSIAEVEALARECGHPSQYSKHRPLQERHYEPYRLAVLFLAYTGVRFGEMAALRISRLDIRRRRAVISESVTVVGSNDLVWGTPKSHQRREVPVPPSLARELAAHIKGKPAQELVFPAVRGGGVIRSGAFRRGHFDAAARAIGAPGLHPHELRHTAASLAISFGADVKVVQHMLGHASATMTLDTYSHLIETRLDEVANVLDHARGLVTPTKCNS